MTFVRIVASALMLTLFAAGATTLPTKTSAAASAANVILTLIGASTAAEARMCDPACRYRCC
jgi:hypothetical protein